VGWGFRPMALASIHEYLDDLMAPQVERGYEVGYFCVGRHYPLLRRPRLWRWTRNGVRMYEVINSPILYAPDRGTPMPEAQLDEVYTEGFFVEALSAFRPDVIHIHDLGFLPSSLLEIASRQNSAAVMTLHDYGPLCPTIKLLNYAGGICLQRNVGSDCVICCAQAPRDPRFTRRMTTRYEARRLLPGFLHTPLKSAWHSLRAVRAKLRKPGEEHSDRAPAGSSPLYGLEEAFQKRRETNIRRLNMLDSLMPNSHRNGAIYQALGVRGDKIVVLHHAHKHIEEIHFRAMTEADLAGPLTFATLNGCASVVKGAYVILNALKNLERMGLANHFKLYVMGGLLESIQSELLAFPNVVYRGTYKVPDLDHLLEGLHVGIVPSVWEESYGYVGIEFLAKGIPVIGNRMGGIVDYTVEGLTGWVNTKNTADGLAEIMARIIRNPSEILQLNRSIQTNYGRLIKTMDRHVDEIENVYKSVIEARRGQGDPRC